MSDLRSPSQPASPVATSTLDQLVAQRISAQARTRWGHFLAQPDAIAFAAAAIEAVAQHLRDASLFTASPLEPLDPRIESAIDDYMSGVDRAEHAAALRKQLDALESEVAPRPCDRGRAPEGSLVFEAEKELVRRRFGVAPRLGGEPTADDTITARVGADGSYSDVKHAGGR